MVCGSLIEQKSIRLLHGFPCKRCRLAETAGSVSSALKRPFPLAGCPENRSYLKHHSNEPQVQPHTSDKFQSSRKSSRA